ncbi:MAG: ABC transporter ATP-binding protein, partial [Bdellovibrionales bacterium]|nr:ABC transporter ATP-binding protein [Bdellovibrionales bacterium]
GKLTHAVHDLTLRIPQGSSVGIIGRNGSGKSTLLKLITGIYRPDTGSVAINGRVAALLELGAGFHPDFSGRENVYLAAVMYGLTKAEVHDLFDSIVEFAELEDVIDDPVRTYSSGMFMRLGFSVAVHVDPDVLLVDEVLAVGDAGFNSKCKDRIAKLRKAGKTLLLVSHDLDAVERWCDEVLWLHEGKVKDRGDPRRVIDHYREFLDRGLSDELLKEDQDAEANGLDFQEPVTPQSEAERARWGSREIEISKVELVDCHGKDEQLFPAGESMLVRMHYVNHQKIAEELVFGIALNAVDGTLLHGSNTEIERVQIPALAGAGVVEYYIDRLDLVEGSYRLDVAVHKADGYPYDYHRGARQFRIHCAVPHQGVWTPVHNWRFVANG